MEKVKKFFGKIQYNAPVVLTFSLLAFAVLLLNMLTNGWTNTYLFSVYRGSPADPLFYLRLFGHVLGHANFEHLVNNFIIILLAGPMLEEKYGGKRMVVMIVVTALVTGLIHVIFAPQVGLLGASGVGFMMILLASFVNLKRGKIPVTLILCVIVFIGREIAGGLTQGDNVSQLTHILGGLCGAAFGFFVNREKLAAPGAADA